MKKLLIASLVCATFGASATGLTTPWSTSPVSGETDSASASIKWESEIPTVVAGKWITFTGAEGGAIKTGKFDINADGTFQTPAGGEVDLELHYYNPETNETGDLVTTTDFGGLGTVNVNKLTYTVGAVNFTAEKGTNVASAKAVVTEHEVSGGKVWAEGVGIDLDSAKTKWAITQANAGDVITDVVAGDKITASTIVTAELEFVAL